MLIVYTLSYLSSVLVYFVLSFAFTLNCYTGSKWMVTMAFLIFLFLFVAGVLASGLFMVKRISKVKWLWLRSRSEGEFFKSKPWKGKEPPVFSGKPADFSEWCFAMEEVLVVVPQNDQVRFVVSYLAADARRWFMTTYSACGRPRPNDWSSLRKELQAAFSPEFEKASHRSRLLKIRQVGALEDNITEFRSLCISSPGVADLTQVILFTEGLKPSVRRVVKQAHAETLQAAMRAARAADCEPEAAGEEPPSV